MIIESCRLCPRNCKVRRGETGEGVCKSGARARVARAALHFWEEPPISGTRGSGAIFFTGCPLGCVYCQNYEISRPSSLGKELTSEELSGLFFSLVEQGAHNINLVTPTHFVPVIRKALCVKRLPVPVVYNTSGYERAETLSSLRGLIDVYLPDFKYAQRELAGALSHAPDYPETALAAIEEMALQVGKPRYDSAGMMVSGVMIRHLILPGHTGNSLKALELLHSRFPELPVSLMAQYTPAGLCEREGGLPGFPELSRRVTRRELQKVEDKLFELDMEGFVQSRKSGGKEYIPDFHQFS